MPFTLFLHPLSSYCHKALIALYETATPFTPHIVDLGEARSREAFKAIWPIGKFPVLRDDESGRIVPESTGIIEWLAVHRPGPVALIPQSAAEALEVRRLDRFFDLHVHTPTQRIIGERLRPAGAKDPYGLAQAQAALEVALALAEKELAGRPWAAGGAFRKGACAAAPPLFFIDMVVAPLAPAHPVLAAYLGRMKQRPSYARVLAEAGPYLHLVPR
jgi:glutathione S-transferase